MMKKLLLSTMAAAVAMAAAAFQPVVTNAPTQFIDLQNVKKAPKELVVKHLKQNQPQRAPKRLKTPVRQASDLVGSYSWNYEQASKRAENAATVTGTPGSKNIIIYDANDQAGTVKVAGMFDGAVTGTLDLTSYDSPTFELADNEEVAYASVSINGQSVGVKCTVTGLFYHQGDAQYAAGWYYSPIVAFCFDNQIQLATSLWITRVINTPLASGHDNIVGAGLNPLWKAGGTFNPNNANNGVSSYYFSNNQLEYSNPVTISQTEDVVTVTNFAGIAINPIDFTLKSDSTFEMTEAPVIFSNDNGDFSLYALMDDNTVGLVHGTGTETKLTFGTPWTGMNIDNNYWIYERGPATITLIGSKFVYPEYVPVVPTYGDLTGDDKVDVADVNAIINIILKLKTPDDYPGDADVTGDNKIDVADVNEIINIILQLS